MINTTIKHFEQYTDTTLIQKILNGDIQLYEIIIRRYNPYLYKTGRAYGFMHEDTQDLMQETYVSAYTNLHNFEGRASLKTWLTKIMLHYCYHRKQKMSFKNELPMHQHEDSSGSLTDSCASNESILLNKELGNILENALHKIPKEYRMVFTLRELNGFNVAETADILAISESNVKVRMNRAKAMLRSQVEKMYAPEDIYEFNLIYCDRIVEGVMSKIITTMADKS